jgi:hypothetical protein
MCIFESLAGYIDDVDYENRNAYVLTTITTTLKAMKSLGWLF